MEKSICWFEMNKLAVLSGLKENYYFRNTPKGLKKNMKIK